MSSPITYRILAPVLCFALLPGCLGYIGDQARFKETRYMTVPHESGSAIRVDTTNGGVSLEAGVGSEVQIEANLACTTEERLAQTEIIANRVNGALHVEVKWPDGRRQNGEGCSFTITLPEASGVEVHTSNGAIKSTGLGGVADLHTSNGGITLVKHNGAVTARTSNGRVRVESTTGDVTAGTSNGAIEIQDARQRVDASTSNGRVAVTLTDSAAGPVRLRTSNGGIDLALGSSFKGELTMSTSNGGLHVDEFTNASRVSIRKTSGSVVFGEGGQSELSTSNGAIHVRSAGTK